MRISPSISSTKYGNNSHEWIPYCFDSFIKELDHIKTVCSSINHFTIYRGHSDSRWLLDSTFIRHVKENILGISAISKVKDDYRNSLEFHRMLGGLFLYKFGTRTQPSQELFDIAKEQQIDPWFEWMKRIQQYPEEDLGPMRGSFLIDWTQNEKVALYFANENRHRQIDAAIWIADVNAMGKVVHQETTVVEILSLFQDALHDDKPFGCPLVFHPKEQIACQRANNQDTIYLAQMDLRFDLSEIWMPKELEFEEDERIFIKLILPRGTLDQCNEWLSENNIDKRFIYPDERYSENTLVRDDSRSYCPQVQHYTEKGFIMENDNDLIQEKLAIDIVSGSMYSLNFLKNITEAIFNPNLKSLHVGEIYDQGLKKCGFSQSDKAPMPYNLGSIIGYIYCGILLAKEKWFNLLPEDKIDEASPDWGFSSATYFSPEEPSPTIKYAIRRIRNALGHGNILFNVPNDIQRNKNDKEGFEKQVTLKFHDEDPKKPGDTFDIEISLFELATAIKKFHKTAYAHVTTK